MCLGVGLSGVPLFWAYYASWILMSVFFPRLASTTANHPTHPSMVVGGWHVCACLLVLAGHVENTAMVSASASNSREHLKRPCPSSQCSQICKWISLTYSVGTFQTVGCFVLFHLLHLGVSLPRGESQFSIALWHPWTPALLVFKARHSGGLSFQLLGCLMWGTNPLLL